MLGRTLLFAVMTLASQNLYAAGMNLQVFGGNRTSEELSGFEYGFASLAQPAKDVPVALGVFAMQQQQQSSDASHRMNGITAGLDAMTWLTAGIWQPYGRIGYDLFSRHRYYMNREDLPAQTAELQGRVRGYHGALGARVKPTPFVGAFFQVDFAEERFEVADASVTQDALKLRSRSLMLGMDLGT